MRTATRALARILERFSGLWIATDLAFARPINVVFLSHSDGQDPEMLLRELREYCQRREMVVIAEYVDKGISGAKDKRPELDRLLTDAHRRRFDSVVVWRFDRLPGPYRISFARWKHSAL